MNTIITLMEIYNGKRLRLSVGVISRTFMKTAMLLPTMPISTDLTHPLPPDSLTFWRLSNTIKLTMLKLPVPRETHKIKAENIDCNPYPAIIVNVSSIVPPSKFCNMETKVRFEEEFQGHQRRQYYATFAVCLGPLAIGQMMCWTSTALPDLRSNEEFRHITEHEESWISSFVTLGAAAACPLMGYLMERLGRRMTMLVVTMPFVIGWLMIFCAQNIPMIYGGRFLTGFCGGAFSVSAPIYIAETADKDIRGKLSAGFDMMITVGMLLMFTIGTFLSWRMQALACASIPILILVCIYFVPESPRFLIIKGRESEAAKSLMWLRGAMLPEQIEQEFNELANNISDSQKAAQDNWKNVGEGVWRAVVIGMLLFLFQVFSGIDAVLCNTVDIFHSAGSTLNDNYSTIVVGAVQVISALCSAAVVDKFGRRVLLMTSEIFMVISLAALGGFFYLKSTDEDIARDEFGWMPLISVLVFVAAFTIGLGPIPYCIMAEILPLSFKGIGSSLLMTIRWILGFFVMRFFNDIMDAMGSFGGYLFFAGVCVVGAIYILFAVPETKGRSLEEIQAGFTNLSNRK